MNYPKFLKKGSTIGICALSNGVKDKLKEYECAINILTREGYKIIETPSVRTTSININNELERVNEFNYLMNNDKVDMILISRGGDFLYTILPNLELNKIVSCPKWIMGYSDPTSILFSITTKYDIATFYGFNSTSYENIDLCVENNLNIIKGNIIKQNSFSKYLDYNKTSYDVKWLGSNDSLSIKGRIIGGCIEVLKDLVGTDFHDINKFNNNYKNDGIIWYFDIYEMNANDFYRTLLQFKYNGWFKNVKGILVSRINNRKEEYLTYEEAIKKALPNIPYITEMCFGHTYPKMTLINGSIATINYYNNQGSIEFELR